MFIPFRLNMRNLAPTVLLSTWFALCGQAQNPSMHFSGQLSRGDEFRKELTRDLVLTLEPNKLESAGTSGWTIMVSPQGDHPPECDDFVWVVTPPFRGYNARYLDTSYGTTAEEAMKFSPRDFNFVLNCSDYERERERVDRLLWPYNYTEEQIKQAEESLGTSPQGKGRLWVRDYKTKASPNPAGDKNAGQIDWISFDVEIEMPKK